MQVGRAFYFLTGPQISLSLTDNALYGWALASRVRQGYNQRKKRKGAFWEDRYHATAVSFDDHLSKCMVYIDMNMVRAGVVNHPSEWFFSGYNEIQKIPVGDIH